MSEEHKQLLEEARQGIAAWIEQHGPELWPHAQKIWRLAELAGQETASAALLTGLLEERGFSVERGVGSMPTAFVARWGSSGPAIAMGCEYDALPGLSQKLDPTHQPVVTGAPGHGCGHNILGVGGILAALAVKQWLEASARPGRVVVLGSPGEEICLGKPFMARDGALDGLDAILDWHPWNDNRATYDVCNSYFSLKYHFKGRTAHGNAPWEGRSALDAAVLTGHAIELLREHIPPGQPSAAHTINYTFSDPGPEFPNVVPDRASMWVIGRLSTAELAAKVLERLHDCARGAALATGTQVETEFLSATHEKLPNQTLATVMHRNFTRVGPPSFSQEDQELAKRLQADQGSPQSGFSQEILPLEPAATAVTDNSEYSWFAPFAMIWVAAVPPGVGWHNWQVTACVGGGPGQKAMFTAAKVMASSAAELYLDPSILTQAKAEQIEHLAGRAYESLLPPQAPPALELNRGTMDKYRGPLAEQFAGEREEGR